MAYYLGLDIGTSATKVIIINEQGTVRAVADSPHEISMPQPGWSEQNPDWWYDASCKATQKAIHGAGISKDDIKAVGFSGQMHGSVFLPANADPSNPKPIRPALLWNDQRTAKQCESIEKAAGGRDQLIKMVSNPALTGLTAPKILWLKENEPENYTKTKALLLPKDYVRFRMTGEMAIDVGDASGTLLLNPKIRNWHNELISKIGLDKEILPAVVESVEQTGTVTKQAAADFGLPAGLPVIAGSGDQMTGAVGMGVVSQGLVSATLGTSGVIFAHSGNNLPDDPMGRVQIMCSAVPGEYCVYGCMLSAAGAMQWFKDTFATNVSFEQLDQEASQINPGADGLIFLPYLTGERCPHPDPLARGSFVGLTLMHTRAHLTRAVLEGVAFGMAGILDLVRSMGINPTEIRLGGGGAKSKLWRNIQTNAYQTPATLLNTAEGSAYGAAILAGVGIGIWSTVQQACEACLQETDRTIPDQKLISKYSQARQVYDDLYPAFKPHFASLSSIS